MPPSLDLLLYSSTHHPTGLIALKKLGERLEPSEEAFLAQNKLFG